MIRLPVYVFFVIGISDAVAGAADPQQVQATAAAKKLVATRTTVAPAIDGKLDDACWRDAHPATGFTVFSDPRELHHEQTIGRVCYDDDKLYISMQCTVRDMGKFKARLAQANGNFQYGKGGVVEVFLNHRARL